MFFRVVSTSESHPNGIHKTINNKTREDDIQIRLRSKFKKFN